MPLNARLALAGILMLSLLAAARAEDAAPVEARETPPAEPAAQPPSAAATAPAPQAHWEGAIGPIFSYGPEYQGAAANKGKVTPGFFLRYGRLTVTNTGGFVTRRADDVNRGLDLDLSRSDRLRVNLGLRYDRGRGESASPELAGLGDIPATLRVRLNASRRLDEHWSLGASWSVDALGRGGGNLGDLSVRYQHRLSKDAAWSWGSSLVLAGDRYLQTYFGVNQVQSDASGYPVYTPRAGLRDVSTSLGLRVELSHDWVWIGSGTVSRMLDSAAASPLTKKLSGWGLSSGVAWRF